MPIIRYDKTQINNIIKNSINCELSDEVVNIIDKLTKMVGDPEYIKTPQFEKTYNSDKREYGDRRDNRDHRDHKDRYNKFKKNTDMDNFNIASSFETREIKKKEGADQYIDIIRKYLNKMTDKTYPTLKDKILETLDLLVKIAEEDELNKISETLFNIMSNNIFFSAMYANLYGDLLKKYDFMKSKMDTSLENYKQLITDIKYVDSVSDYDKFCENNKVNENNRAILLFYVNLMREEVIEKETILEIITFIYDRFFEYMEETNRKNEVEELSELLYLLIKNSHEKLIQCEAWEKINSNIEYISKLKAKDKPSISNKAIFKHMDIIDEFN